MIDLVERLRYATKDVVTGQRLNPGVYGHAPIEDLEQAADEIEELRSYLEEEREKNEAQVRLTMEAQAEIERLREEVRYWKDEANQWMGTFDEQRDRIAKLEKVLEAAREENAKLCAALDRISTR